MQQSHSPLWGLWFLSFPVEMFHFCDPHSFGHREPAFVLVCRGPWMVGAESDVFILERSLAEPTGSLGL